MPQTETATKKELVPLGGLAQVLGQDSFSLAAAIGGWRGFVESVLPGLIFVVAFIITGAIMPAAIGAGAISVISLLVRLVQRLELAPAITGIVSVIIGVVWARQTGNAANYFAGGLLANVAYLAVTVISVLVRLPLVGVVMGLVTGKSWRCDPSLRRRYSLATWVLASLFAMRLLVQVPLYLTGQVTALATAKLVMGIPLTALIVWAVWLISRPIAPHVSLPDQH